jgi:hypothetical protein
MRRTKKMSVKNALTVAFRLRFAAVYQTISGAQPAGARLAHKPCRLMPPDLGPLLTQEERRADHLDAAYEKATSAPSDEWSAG